MAARVMYGGHKRLTADGTVDHEERCQPLAEAQEECRIREGIQEDRTAAMAEYWRLVEAGESRKVAVQVVKAADRRARERLAPIEERERAQTRTWTTRRGWPAARVERASMAATAARPARRTGTRTRGAGRPAARHTSTAASGGGGSSGESDSDGPGEPPGDPRAHEREASRPLTPRHLTSRTEQRFIDEGRSR